MIRGVPREEIGGKVSDSKESVFCFRSKKPCFDL